MMLKRPFWNYLRILFLNKAEQALYYAGENCVNWEMHGTDVIFHLANENRLKIHIWQHEYYASFGITTHIKISRNLYGMAYRLVYPEQCKIYEAEYRERLEAEQEEVKKFLAKLN